jgi:hypothetical protein
MGCESYYIKQARDGYKTRTNSKDHDTYAYIVGDPGDIDRVEIMLESLNRQMERERERDQRRQYFNGMGQKKVWNATYIRSYAARIFQRMSEAYSEAISEAGGGAEMVLVSRKQAIINEMQKVPLTTTTSSRQWSRSGHEAGRAAADRAEIWKGVES